MVAILALTCGRPGFTVETWRHNFANHGMKDAPRVYWFDNGSTPDELRPMMKEAEKYNFVYSHFEAENKGIAYALNHLLQEAARRGHRQFMTMANDIKEPAGWLYHRLRVAQEIENTGVVAIPVVGSARYGRKKVKDWEIEEGTVIGNWLITEQAYNKIGGFCMDYGIYGPLDIDYCERMKVAGLKYYYLGNFHAAHLGETDRNPPEYERAKKASLNIAWETFKKNQKAYRVGAKIYQDA